MRIWAITVGEPLPCDSSGSRLYRTGMLVRELAMRRHQVSWWTSTFDHFTKSHRNVANTNIACAQQDFAIEWISSPGYKQNVSINRIVDHYRAGRDFARKANERPRPDLILCSLPTLDLALVASAYGRRQKIPVIIDVRDWWPDEFPTAFSQPLRLGAEWLCLPFRRMAKQACASATAITWITEAFVDWGLRMAGRPRTETDRAFYMGYSGQPPTAIEQQKASEYWRSLDVSPDPDKRTVCYLGNFSDKVELDRVIEAATLLGPTFRFLLCGDGHTRSDLMAVGRVAGNVIMPGRVGRAELWTAMQLSDFGIAPYLPTPSFAATLSNKMLEYLAGGLPILTSIGQGTLPSLLEEYSCGASYEYGNVSSLVQALRDFGADRVVLANMKRNARTLFERRFVAEQIYSKMADYLEAFVSPPTSIDS